MTAVQTIDVEWVRRAGDGTLRERFAAAADRCRELDHGVAAPGVPLGAERRDIGSVVRRLIARLSPPVQYRLTATSAGSCNFQDWESLMAGVAYLREMGFDLSTLQVESPSARSAAQPSAETRPVVGASSLEFARTSERRRRHEVVGRMA